MYDIAIIGAGVIGGMIARALSFYDVSVCLIEKESDVATGATKANSAIVHAGFDAKVGTLKAKLNVRGSKMMPQIAKALGVKYINNGSLVVGFNEEDKSTLKDAYQQNRTAVVDLIDLLSRLGNGCRDLLLGDDHPFDLTFIFRNRLHVNLRLF